MTELIITSSVLILVLILLRHFLKGKISLRLQYALWLLVLIRLLVPITLFESPISVMNAVKQSTAYKTAEQTLIKTQYYSDVIRHSEMTPDEARETGNGSLHEIQGYPSQSGYGNLRTYIYMDSLGVILTRILRNVWLAGIAVVGLTLLLSNLSFSRKLKKTRIRWQTDNCKLPVYLVEALTSPCLFGFFHPAIYLTPDVVGDETKLRHVLAHELTHYRHVDQIWSALRCLCLTVHWYNPLVWLAAKLSRRDSELACDEGAIKCIGEASRMEYGRTLIGLTCEKRKAIDLLCCATTMTDGKKGIKERITLVAKKPKLLIPALITVVLVTVVAVGCTFTGAKAENAEIITLTADEVEAFNKAFEPLLYDEQGNPISVNPVSQFITSYYDRPEDINLAELLRYFPSDGGVTDEAEFEALKAAENWPFGADAALGSMPVPIHKFAAGTVNDALEKYMGIKLDDLSGVGKDELVYLKDYAAYYNFTSDAGFGSFICTSGEKQGDTVRLFGETATLTLKMKGNGFVIVSHQKIESESGKENEDVTLFDCNGFSVAIPNDYIDKLLVMADPEPEAAKQGLLISVYEKQSYEDIHADYGQDSSGGFLFSIVRYTQAQYEQFLCSGGSGQSFFARDNAHYYGWFVPTDVQLYRSGMGSVDINSDEWNAWDELNTKCSSIKDDFVARNHLTYYSDSDFRGREFTYDSEHLYVTYYPYYIHQDTAAAQGIRWQDVMWTLVLSQPATQGNKGIWCVERWFDENGNRYIYFPDANGVPAAEYYVEEQSQCDAGHKLGALDPKQVALTFIEQCIGHTDVTFDSIIVGEKPVAAGKPIVSADVNE